MSDFQALIATYVTEAMRRNRAVIETACEQALQSGVCGVRVDHHLDGSVTAQVDPTVPYGEIHEHRDRW